jgi:hypothetical protein
VRPSRVTASAADVGGVGGPVPGGDLLPLDRGLDVDAECLGQDGGRDVGGQGEQCGGAALARADSEGVKPLGERVLGQRASRLASREEPGRRDVEQAAARWPAASREPGREILADLRVLPEPRCQITPTRRMSARSPHPGTANPTWPLHPP